MLTEHFIPFLFSTFVGMEWEGNLRKMRSDVDDGMAQYVLTLKDVLADGPELKMNDLVGQEIRIEFLGQIHCRATGQLIKKTYGEGLSYRAFMDSPLATESIIRPELSRIHEGIALRDEAWERENHLQPHITYLSFTSGIKVGVTRATNVPSRWVDQGAVEAIFLAETPYRQAAGLIEVALKEHVADKTNWRQMLMGASRPYEGQLLEMKDKLVKELPPELGEYISGENQPMKINFPVERYPVKVKSLKLDKFPLIEKKLCGIKGQYLLFSDDTVMNIRSHAAYRVKISV